MTYGSSSKTRSSTDEEEKFHSLAPARRSRAYPLELYDHLDAHETRTPEEWLKWCADFEAGGLPSADVLHLRDGHTIFLPCSVRSYDARNKRFLVIVPSEGSMLKRVSRLRLRFRCEDPADFSVRTHWARQCRNNAFLQMEMDHRLRVKCRELGISMPTSIKQHFNEAVSRSLKYLSDKSSIESLEEVLGDEVKQLIQEVEVEYNKALTKCAMGFRQSEFLTSQRTIELVQEARKSLVPPIAARSRRLIRRTRFSIPLLRAFNSCSKALGEVMSLCPLVIDWSRYDYSSDPTRLITTGKDYFKISHEEEYLSEDDISLTELPLSVSTLTFSRFVKQMSVHQERVSEIVNRHWREFVIRNFLDNLVGTFDFLREDRTIHLQSQQHSVCHMFDVMIGHELSRWAENSLEEWVEAVEEARLLPELQIEIDLSAAGQVVLSPNQSEILETFDSFIEGVESLASTFSSIEPELFPQPEIPEEHLFALDSELVMSSKERLRRVLLEDLQEALKVVDAYSAYEELIAELTPPESAEEVDLNIVRDFLSQCAQRLEEVGRVCPGGIQTRLFFVDTSIATRKLSAMISQASTDCLLAMSQELQRNTEDIRDAYRSLDKHFNTPENDYEAERLLRMVENIDKQTLDPLEARISQLVEVLDFLDTSMFLISLDLRVEIYDLRTKAPDVRTDFRLLCEELKLIFEPPAEDEESDE